MKKKLGSILTLGALAVLVGCSDNVPNEAPDIAEQVVGKSEVMEKKADEMAKSADNTMKKEPEIVANVKDVMVKEDTKAMEAVDPAAIAKTTTATATTAASGIYAGTATIVLDDVSGGTASGEAWTVVKDGKTFHRTVGKNLPPLTNGDFYEGWLVKNAALGQFLSTGKMTQDANGDFVLEYLHNSDISDHKKVVITLEPDDGDPAPAAHIIEN